MRAVLNGPERSGTWREACSLMRAWIDANYKLLMLGGMVLEILLIAYLCVKP